MKQRLTLITISGCDRCEGVKEDLGLAGISYDEINCDDYPELCDKVEDASKSYTYPFAVLDNNKKQELIYVADSYEDLKLDGLESRLYILRPHATLHNLIQTLKKYK
jgi:glutaredoxin